MIESSRKHVLKKYGPNGYAKEKMYFEGEEYERFLDSITSLGEDKEAFSKRYIEVNKLDFSL